MKTEFRMQNAECRMLNPASPITHHASRLPFHASRSTLHSPRATRPSERGVALVITLVLLTVITFMAVTFLVVSSSQHGSVTTETEQATARLNYLQRDDTASRVQLFRQRVPIRNVNPLAYQ